MGKQASRAGSNGSKRSRSFGKGNVTPTQVAFIVDQYLLDNGFSETRSAFRTEASSLLANASLNDAPRGLLSLEAILNEYISLKEQKVIVDHEKVQLEQEKRRVHDLLQGMQNAMNAYNTSGNSAGPSVPAVVSNTTMALPPTQSVHGSPSGLTVYRTPMPHPESTPSNVNTQLANSSPVTVYPPAINKRKDSSLLSVPPPLAKRSRGKSTARIVQGKGNGVSGHNIAEPSCVVKSSSKDSVPTGSSQHGSSVAKCLFNQSSMPVPPNTSVPMTPPRENSSQSEKSVSPLEISSVNNCSTDNTPEGFTTTRCTLISSKRVTVSPFKQITYSMERNHCFSTSSPVKSNLKRPAKRDHVKGRLDFDGSDASTNLDKPVDDHTSTSESEKEVDIFDIDLPSIDVIGADFSFTEMLREFDLECEEMGYSCQPTADASVEDASGSSPESMDGNVGADQLVSEFSSTVTEVLSQKYMTQGPDSLTAVQSVTRCIKIISPVKNRGSPVQNCSPTTSRLD